MDYWRAFVNEFFIPTGVFRLILWNTASREQKGFEVPTCVLPRFLLTNYVSGLRSSQLQLENPREYQTGWPPVNPLPPPPTFAQVSQQLSFGQCDASGGCVQSDLLLQL